MMASGQNPLLLAAQQGTQVSQVLNQMGKDTSKVHALGAAFMQMVNPTSLVTLGVIAGGAAIGQWAISAIGASGGTRDLKESLDALSDSVSEFNEYADLAAASSEDLEKRFGNMAKLAPDVAEFLSGFSRDQAINQLKSSVENLTESYGMLNKSQFAFERIGGFGGLDIYQNLRRELGLTDEQRHHLRSGEHESPIPCTLGL